jgi:hypothetical protein
MANNDEGPGYTVDTAWYSDTGAIGHITTELGKLAMRESTPARSRSMLPMVEVCVTLCVTEFLIKLVKLQLSHKVRANSKLQ